MILHSGFKVYYVTNYRFPCRELIEGERRMKRKQLKLKQNADYLKKLGELTPRKKMDEFSQTFKKPNQNLTAPTKK